MDLLTLCLLISLPVLPPRPDLSGWHVLRRDPAYGLTQERWFWDARLRIWRRDPVAFLAETPQQMRCDAYDRDPSIPDLGEGAACDALACDEGRAAEAANDWP